MASESVDAFAGLAPAVNAGLPGYRQSERHLDNCKIGPLEFGIKHLTSIVGYPYKPVDIAKDLLDLGQPMWANQAIE